MPGAGGGYDFARPTLAADVSTWFGPWGLTTGVTVFNRTYANFRPTPFFEAGTPMIDVLLRRRVDVGAFQLLAGYRGLGRADVNFASVGFSMWRPLPVSWARLELRGLAGHNVKFGTPSRSYVDGQALVTAYWRNAGVSLGFRHLSMMSGSEPTFHVNGPLAQLRIDI